VTDNLQPDVSQDYKTFIDGDERHPPSQISALIQAKIVRDIHPTRRQVLVKLLVLHAAALVLTLTVCPQFGLGPLGGGHGIMHVVMKYGEAACAVFCATVLFGTTLAMAGLFLNRHELQLASTHSLSTAVGISSLSYAFFMLLDVVTTQVVVSLSYGLVWLAAGAVILFSMRLLPLRRPA
jgi:hypothetical protein